MEEDNNKKSKLGIIIAVVLGILGVGTISGLLTKGPKVLKVVKASNTVSRTLKSGKAAVKNEEVLSFSESMRLLEESHSLIDTTKTINDANERSK